ncbi:hsp90-like protein [Sodiomyces alkalinus F11]|uniref:histidine kinase n=1 Tax=Sodiomyces alkalinus (strain CBS 110278 / VKM F-3762 / F11) TaxID=1314773 RepID=A0A3N2PXW6_SODAK|nr:hsp90-like protein [Sodiomyces alkalinus F11]ROT39371.1 hsp90-like protein [Sodiomyces alkalinus F11]
MHNRSHQKQKQEPHLAERSSPFDSPTLLTITAQTPVTLPKAATGEAPAPSPSSPSSSGFQVRQQPDSQDVALSLSPDDVSGRTKRENNDGGGEEVTTAAAKPAALTLSQVQLNQYRERLAQELERRDMATRGAIAGQASKTRVSPVQEETTTDSSPTTNSSATTTSSKSGNTIRGAQTPGLMATPSYPFPRMTTPGRAQGSTAYPFSIASQPGPRFVPQGMSFDAFAVHDKVVSSSSTSASAQTFGPSGFAPQFDHGDFPTPNIYNLSLMLAAEPGLDAWWATVVQIMRDVFKAERVTLAVPADTTDVDNVPWGQKATYNSHEKDGLSLAYMAPGSSVFPSSTDDIPTEDAFTHHDDWRYKTQSRPGLQARHSFTSYEDTREKQTRHGEKISTNRRPTPLSRSKSYFPSLQTRFDFGSEIGDPTLDPASLAEHDDVQDEQVPSWEAPLASNTEGAGRVLPVLQALDYEADPLIDHSGIRRVLERGKVVALTRSYPYLQNQSSSEAKNKPQQESKAAGDGLENRPRRARADSSAKLSALLGGANAPRGARGTKDPGTDKGAPSSLISRLEEEPEPLISHYEESEQAPPSPWSQSPAPSPAVRADPKENPFFSDAVVDEESFNPSTAPPDYSSLSPPEAIGVDNSWTVLHIPLLHPLLSKPMQPFKPETEAEVLESKAHFRTQNETPTLWGAAGHEQGRPSPQYLPRRDKPTPIAVISILSPMIPYPSTLRHTLEHLGSHLATSFSLCRHYTNLETELAGLQRRRPHTAGFGAIAADGRPLVDHGFVTGFNFAPTGGVVSQQSIPSSITSPSDYSAVSKSAAGSPGGTPGFDQASVSMIMEGLAGSSPALLSGPTDNYFSTKQKPNLSRADTSSGTGSGSQRTRNTQESSPVHKRKARLSGTKLQGQNIFPTFDSEGPAESFLDDTATAPSRVSSRETKEVADEGTVQEGREGTVVSDPRQNRHTLLHSYGADFASTFQSLPPSSSVVSRPTSSTAPSRSGSLSIGPAADLPPPSDRLKGLILDSLPAHVFVALPQTGEVVWVNSRYLTYRGQTVADLAADPWGSIHREDRDEYLKAWGHSLRTGEQFSRTVRIRRFDGVYRWFYARAVASRDKRGVLMQFLGSYMDIHDQHIAELKAARQEEIEASEAKHRLLANLIPQIIFTATEDDGITFGNDQWLSYSGQSFEDSLGLGFMDYVHPEDLAKCKIPTDRSPTPLHQKTALEKKSGGGDTLPPSSMTSTPRPRSDSSPESNIRGVHQALSRSNSSSSSSVYEMPSADLTELARKGIVKVSTDSSGRLSYTTEVRLRSKSGEYRWHLVRCVEIEAIDFGNGASSFFGSATDINDHKLLEGQLKEAMESKSRFLSNMSHEIRTPLIGISGMVSFLQDSVLNEEQRDYTNTIQTSANSLLMIINDILDLSKVDAGMMKLKYEWFHMRALIEDVNELVSTMAIAKHLELNYVVEQDVPTWVKGDKVRIRQVLLNVIGNAIKFTSEGEVFSRCRVFRDDTSVDGRKEIMLEFAVIDTGRGFSKEEAELIFKPFSQIDGSSTRQHGGSGLGLVISRQLVELHGGKMDGTAVPGKGSTFAFTARFALPTVDDHPEVPVSPLLTPSRPEFSEVPLTPLGFKPVAAQPQPPSRLTSTPASSDLTVASVPSSGGSSVPSIHSSRSQMTDGSSVPSMNVGLARFSEAARASGQDLSQMKLQIPSAETSAESIPAPGHSATTTKPPSPPESFRPLVYSILIICPQMHSREATTQHIEHTLAKDVPHQITALESVDQADELMRGEDPVHFTHIVLNLPTPEQLMSMLGKIEKYMSVERTTILVLSDASQRQAVMNLAAEAQQTALLSEDTVTFISKPVKPSRFAVIFDPDKVRDSSIDRNRSTAQRVVESQKASYQEIEKRMGNKGYKVLLVEDNPVNQKVLRKYLNKIGVAVEIAADGTECTEMVFSRDHAYYSLILCDLHMPRKDGYQACREVRQWEKKNKFKELPIIALSANVMSDVQEKCASAGFSDFVTKPVDFIDLSRAMARFF